MDKQIKTKNLSGGIRFMGLSFGMTSGVGVAVTMILSNRALGQAGTNAISNTSSAITNKIETSDSIWTRSTLGGDWGGLRPQLNDHGVSFRIELTQFGSGMTGGEGSKSWEYGGKGDVYLTVDGAKAGLWDGLFIGVRGEQNYGRDVNGYGGTLLPNNASLAFPGTRDGDIGLEITQKFSDEVAIKFGKLNMVDAAKATPIKGGGGIDTFMNTALAVPPSGLIPPEVFGAFLNISTKPVSYVLAVYDPNSAAQRTGLEHPFRDGVSFRAGATLSAKPLGLQGFYGVKAMYSTLAGLDLRSIPDLLFPPETGTVRTTRANPYFFGVSVQQYLYQDANDPKRGWGFFGELGFSDGNPTVQQWAGYFGLGGTSPLPGRGADLCGVAVFRNSLSDYLVQGLSPVLRLRDEQGLEAFYNVAVTPWLHVTADIQWVSPYQENYPNAVFAALRTNIKF
jgi:porin